MKIYFGGGVGHRPGPVAKLLEALAPVLQGRGHTVLKCGPTPTESALYDANLACITASDLFIAPVDAPTMELGADLQEAIRVEKPVLCITDGRNPIASAYLIGADAEGVLDLTAFRDVDDAAEKICAFAVIAQAQRAAA